jgi:NADPH-dependent glutamate synthase beta subunit-like oxidoreductase/NAD-dependent dihydropyrimidine dehydrogenase PreA subunit
MTSPAVCVPPLYISRSHLTTESNKTGSWRFLRPRYDEKTAPCSAACPAGEDIARIEMLTTQGYFKEAWETILQENPFPAVCGRVCFHPCEGACNRGDFDEAIAIPIIERFLADTAARNELKPNLSVRPARTERVAIVGAGPGGLAAAYFLARLGYDCDIFEAQPEPGGILRWGIPTYRLQPAVLRKEIALIESLGVRIHCSRHTAPEFLLDAGNNYVAVFLGCGHGRGLKLGIPGEDLSGVEDGLRFLERLRHGESPSLHGTVAVIGGGNTAMDVARTVRRLGAQAIMIYRRRRQDMRAFADEISMALEEGVEIRELLTPVSIEASTGGYRLTLQQMRALEQVPGEQARIEPEPGSSTVLEVQQVITAIGAREAELWMQPPDAENTVLKLNNCFISRSPERPVLIYGGDLVADIKSVVHAVASGKEAALALDVILRAGFEAMAESLAGCRVGTGPALSMEMYLEGPRCRRNAHIVTFEEINSDYFQFAPRIVQPRLLREERLQSFAEVDLKISAGLAMRETERCFNCGLCNQCDNCRLFCPDIAVKRDESSQGRHIDYDYCKGCGLCVVECPRHAMTLEEEPD